MQHQLLLREYDMADSLLRYRPVMKYGNDETAIRPALFVSSQSHSTKSDSPNAASDSQGFVNADRISKNNAVEQKMIGVASTVRYGLYHTRHLYAR